jgi:hypothetical protein
MVVIPLCAGCEGDAGGKGQTLGSGRSRRDGLPVNDGHGALAGVSRDGRLVSFLDRVPVAPQHEGGAQAATLCHEPTVGQDWPGGGRASTAGELPAAAQDPLELHIGRIDGLSGDRDRRLMAPVGVPEDHP